MTNEPAGNSAEDLVTFVAAMIHASDREDMGKTCLQKTAYILQAKGLGFSSIVFDYYKYGPFSPEIAFAADDAEALNYISRETYRGNHPLPYTVFRPKGNSPSFPDFVAREQVLKVLDILKRYAMLDLELAATAIYLKNNGHRENFIQEVKKRKPRKATASRMERVERLLRALSDQSD